MHENGLTYPRIPKSHQGGTEPGGIDYREWAAAPLPTQKKKKTQSNKY